MRASQAERDHAVDRLRVHAGEGRLELDELEERVEAAYTAKTHGELTELFRDLPEPAPRPMTRSHRASSGSSERAAVVRFLPLIAAIAVFVLAPAAVSWIGWVLLAWWFFGSHAPGHRPMACGSRRSRERRTAVV